MPWLCNQWFHHKLLSTHLTIFSLVHTKKECVGNGYNSWDGYFKVNIQQAWSTSNHVNISHVICAKACLDFWYRVSYIPMQEFVSFPYTDVKACWQHNPNQNADVAHDRKYLHCFLGPPVLNAFWGGLDLRCVCGGGLNASRWIIQQTVNTRHILVLAMTCLRTWPRNLYVRVSAFLVSDTGMWWFTTYHGEKWAFSSMPKLTYVSLMY
jgi:hypothetical protein